MFSTSDIVHSCSAKSFNRGKDIAGRKGSIEARAFIPGKQRCDISADVRSSSGIAERFHAYVSTDPEVSSILDYECTCPAARKFEGMCKHCVALAHAFKSDPSSFSGFDTSLKVSTSRSLKAFMNAAPSRRDLRLEDGSVHLIPTFMYDFGQWSLRLDICANDVRYVISDIADFGKAVASQSYYSYGQRLGFVHQPETFDSSSQGLAAFAAEAYVHSPSARREIELDETDVVRLVKSLNGENFLFVDTVSGSSVRETHVIDAEPEISLRIIEAEGDAFEIVRDERLVIAYTPSLSCIFIDGEAYFLDATLSQAAAFLANVYSSADDELILAREDAPEFCANVLPSIESALNVSFPESLEVLRPREASFSFFLDKSGRGKNEAIECTLKVDYGQGAITLLEPAGPEAASRRAREAASRDGSKAGNTSGSDSHGGVISYRDEDEENAVCELVFEYFDIDMRIPLDNETAAGDLLYEGLLRFRSAGDVFTTRAFDSLISDKRAGIQIGLSLSGNLIDMDVHATDVSSEELEALLGSYQRHKRFHRMKDGSIASLEQMNLDYLDRMSQDLGFTAKDLAKGVIELPTYAAFMLEREYAQAHRDKSFESYIERFESDTSFVEKPPKGLKAKMRNYQMEGLKWMAKLSSIGFGGILADEMGLGKTLQAIAYLLWAKDEGSNRDRNEDGIRSKDERSNQGTGEDGRIIGEDGDQSANEDRIQSRDKDGESTGDKGSLPALVVAPASLVYNWIAEFRRFAPSLSCAPIDGTKAERRRRRQTPGIDVFVASYDAVRMDVDEFMEMSLSCVFLDEAQFIKNHATKTTRAVKRLEAEHRFALTGTPIENRLSEIWSIFDFLMPGFLGTYAQFRRRFEIDILGGDEEVASHFQSLVAPFVLRRLKTDVLEDLPEKQESVVLVSLDGEQRKLYDASEQNLRQDLLQQRKEAHKKRTSSRGAIVSDGLKVDVLAELMRLREIALEPSLVYSNYNAGSSKTDAVIELVGEAMESGRKSLVFSQFTSYLKILKDRLDAEGIGYYEITGSTPKKARLDLVNEFNENDVPVFLVSLKAGGTGLNLIGASVVIHADPWWNAAAINQATDRAHRIGQTEMVSVYKVIAKDTIEERILKLQEMKADLANSVVSKTSLDSLSSLTRDELESLLLD